MVLNEFYHVGMIVDNFDTAVARMTQDFGTQWSPEIRVTVPVWIRGLGVRSIDTCAVYSTIAPHLEIVAAVPGTPWVVRPGRPVHHLGYWTDDMAGAVAELEKEGWSRLLHADDNGRMFGMVYLDNADGQYIEMVDRASFPDWNGFLAGKMQHEVIRS